jgi:hypothetical protein
MSLVLVNKRSYLASITTNEARKANTKFNRDNRKRNIGIGILSVERYLVNDGHIP